MGPSKRHGFDRSEALPNPVSIMFGSSSKIISTFIQSSSWPLQMHCLDSPWRTQVSPDTSKTVVFSGNQTLGGHWQLES